MQMIIDGKKTDAGDGKVIHAVNPATGKTIDTFPSVTKEDVDRCLEAAQRGKRLWAATPINERNRILYRFVDLLEQHAEELAQLLCREMGKHIVQSRAEVLGGVDTFRAFVEYGRFMDGETYPDPQASGLGDVAFTVREPLGVVVCIVPFNFPVTTLTYKIAPALVCGNAAIIKPASDISLTLIRYTELLLEAGVPGSVAQVVTGPGATMGEYLVDTEKVDCVSFTGSTEVGVRLTQLSAKYLHHVLMELGGNDAVIIFEDADLAAAAKEAVMLRAKRNVGQTCMATKRYLVHNSVRRRFTELLVEEAGKLRMGDPQDEQYDLGCLVSERAAQEVEDQVRHCIDQGAKLLCGGQRNGAFYTPTVLGDVTADMDVAQNLEIFGPVLPIIGFDTEEEAVEIANNTQFGLNGGVVSGDLKRALRVAAQIQAGTVVANGMSLWRRHATPFGGYKMSGLGREGIRSTMEEMSQPKIFVIKGI